MSTYYERNGIDPNGGVNSPDEFWRLPANERQEVLKKIRDLLEPANKPMSWDSYRIKHLLPSYATNGVMKGGCLALGFRIVDASRLNWQLYARLKK